MAANYKVNIQLDTKTLDKQLRDLGVKVDKVGKVKQQQGKKSTVIADKEIKQEQRKISLQNQFISNATKTQKISSKMVDFDKTKNLFADTKNKLQAGELDLAKKGILLTKQDILQTQKLVSQEKKVTAEKVKQVNLQSAGMNLIRLSGRAGKLGGRSAAVIDQQTALRQPKALPSASMLAQRLGGDPASRGIKRLIPERLTDAGRIVSRDDTGGIRFTATSAKKAAVFEERINKARKRGIANNKKLIGSEVLRNKQTIQGIKATEQAATAEARRLNQALRNPIGPSSPLNRRGGQLLPGPAGSGRGSGLTSALISGAFPLLFGQGPLAAAGGFTGGLVGDKLGGQMGGFAGGLIGTAVVSGVQSFVNSIKELGSALDPVNGSASQAVQSLGFLSSARAREIALIEKQIGKQSALAAVRKEMTETLGAGQTLALQEAAKDIGSFQKSIQKSMAKFKGDVAKFMKDVTPGSAVERQMINRGVGTDPQSELSKTFLANQAAAQSITGRSLEARIAGFTEASGFLGSGEGRITQAGKAELKRLKAEREIMEVKLRALGIEDKVSSLVKDTNLTFMEQLTTRRTAFDLESRVLELRSQGINPAIAKEMAMFEKINSDNVTGLKSEIDLRKEVLKTTTDKTKQQILQDEIAGLEKGLVLLRKQNKERIDAVKKTMELNMRTDLVVSSAQKLKETLVTDIGEGIKGLIRGTSTLNDVLNNVLNKMIDAAFNMALFGNFGGSFMPGLGILGSIFRANGGPVKGGGSYIVGEKGPEVFTPGVSGMITPNEMLGGTTNVVVNVDASGSSVEGDEEQGRELGRMISVAIQSELIKQKRPGGMLA